MAQLGRILIGLLAAASAATPLCASAQEPIKIGLPMPLTGVLAAVGKQAVAGAELYVALHGDTIAGRKILLVVRDDASLPDVSRRIAQEMIVNDKVSIIGGGLTPNVLAISSLVTAAKMATVVMVSGTSIVTERAICRSSSPSSRSYRNRSPNQVAIHWKWGAWYRSMNP